MSHDARPAWAVRLETERERRGWNKHEMARRLLTAAGTEFPPVASLVRQVRRWERGERFPRDWTSTYAAAYGIAENELFGDAGVLAPEDVTKRRNALKLGLVAAAVPTVRQRVVEALEVLENDHLSAVIDSLGDLVDQYALTICSRPPIEAYDELLAVRSYASTALKRAMSSPHGVDLSLSVGWLSHLLSVAACDMGEHGAARVWCSDAERRSHDARHPDLKAWSILTRALIAFYQGQPRRSVMLSAQGQHASPVGTVVHAKLASQEMRAAAQASDADGMASAQRHASEAIAALPPDAAVTGAFSIALAEDPPYTATSLLLLGRFREAVSATDRVIQTVYRPEANQRGEHPSGYARALLIMALAQAGAGRLDESVAAGHAALNGSRPAWPTMVLADRLDQALGHRFPDAGEVAHYHARYREAARLALRPDSVEDHE